MKLDRVVVLNQLKKDLKILKGMMYRDRQINKPQVPKK